MSGASRRWFWFLGLYFAAVAALALTTLTLRTLFSMAAQLPSSR